MSVVCGHITMNKVKLTKVNTGYDTKAFPTTIQQERKPSGFMRGDAQTVRRHCEARDLAFEAILALYSGRFEESKKKAQKALSLNPECTDAYLARLLAMTQLVDGDTVLYGLRELLGKAHQIYSFYMNASCRICYQLTRTRPYIRILMAIGCVAYGMNRIHTATQAYEVVLGMNGTDAPNARHPLVSCYLIIIGLQRQGECLKVKRTATHLKELLRLEHQGISVFGPDEQEPMKRWAQIFLSYMQAGPKDRWENLVLEEWRRDKEFVQAILNPIHVCKSPIPKVFFDTDDRNFEDVIDPSVSKKKINDRVYEMLPPIDDFTTTDYLKRAMKEWPDMARHMRELLGLTYEDEIAQDAPDSHRKTLDGEVRETQERKYQQMIEELIHESRRAIEEGRYRDGLDACTKAKQIVLAIFPTTERWFEHAKFMIASNRATCASLLEEWEIARLDSMITLVMKPDHLRTYERLPRIASVMFCPVLTKALRRIADDCKSSDSCNEEKWKRRSSHALALMSFSAMWESRVDIENFKDSLELCDISPFFTPICDWRNNPPPYLSCEDMEPFDDELLPSDKTARIVRYSLELGELDMAWFSYNLSTMFPFISSDSVRFLLGSL